MKTDQKGKAMTVALGGKKATFCTIFWLQNSWAGGQKRLHGIGRLGRRCKRRVMETDG